MGIFDVLFLEAWFLFLTTSRWFAMRLDFICSIFVTITAFGALLLKDREFCLFLLVEQCFQDDCNTVSEQFITRSGFPGFSKFKISLKGCFGPPRVVYKLSSKGKYLKNEYYLW